MNLILTINDKIGNFDKQGLHNKLLKQICYVPIITAQHQKSIVYEVNYRFSVLAINIGMQL